MIGKLIVLVLFVPFATATPHVHSGGAVRGGHKSLADNRFEWPSLADLAQVVSLEDYTIRQVFFGTSLLGACAGLVGTFTLLRKRALVGDVVSHASLPGIAIAFLVAEALRPGSGRSLPILLTGACLAGLIGIACATAIRTWTRIKEDAALAMVLSLFFGAGIVLFTVIQKIPTGNSAGLQHFIYGKAASMLASDVRIIMFASIAVLIGCLLLLKEFTVLCFDEQFAAAQGWPVMGLDLLLMALVVGVTVIGLQSVGLLLVVALLIIPPASARFWTDQLSWLTVLSTLFGGAAAMLGVVVSALFPKLSAGAVIVLVGSLGFVASMFLGLRRGVLRTWVLHWQAVRRVGRHDLLRACYEEVESLSQAVDLRALQEASVEFTGLLARRSWSTRRLERLVAAGTRAGLVFRDATGRIRLSSQGAAKATQAVRNHRLWETYLIHYADIAPTHVDRDADEIEHVLGPELIAELEETLAEDSPSAVPPSPHQITELDSSPRR